MYTGSQPNEHDAFSAVPPAFRYERKDKWWWLSNHSSGRSLENAGPKVHSSSDKSPQTLRSSLVVETACVILRGAMKMKERCALDEIRVDKLHISVKDH